MDPPPRLIPRAGMPRLPACRFPLVFVLARQGSQSLYDKGDGEYEQYGDSFDKSFPPEEQFEHPLIVPRTFRKC